MAVSTSVHRKIWVGDDHFLEVFPWPDAPGCVALAPTGKANKEYFGDFNIPMDPDLAEHVGRALIAAAEEARNA